MSTQHQVQFVRIEPAQQGQRLDNFLMRFLKGVPRSHVYRIIRRGEVRINKKRSKPESRLEAGDLVRVPPYIGSDPAQIPRPGPGLVQLLKDSVLFEDEQLLIINKPAGIAVHGGSGIRLGLIEAVRQISDQWSRAELAHRLDRDTSGCIVLCKNMNYLKDIQQQLKAKTVNKHYLALVVGHWPTHLQEIDAPLQKNILSSGERMVRVDAAGKRSRTGFRVVEHLQGATLVEAMPVTGRTHQIRVHCEHAGHPIVGDPKYGGDRDRSALSGYAGANKLCLHAWKISFSGPGGNGLVQAEAEPPESLQNLISELRKNN